MLRHIRTLYALLALGATAASHVAQFILTNSNVRSLNFDASPTFWYQQFEPNCSTSVILHGWRGSAFDESYERMADAYVLIEEQCFNTIRVNWPDGANDDYEHAMSAMGLVAEEIAVFLKRLQRLELVTKVEVVGFSLGAHLAGLVSRALRLYFGAEIVAEIVGLDPAGPGFTDLFLTHEECQLQADDAEVVVVLSTNAGCTGTSKRSGSVNFIANNGRDQIGCAAKDCACSHRRALDIFIESLTSTGFIGREITSPTQDRRALFGRGRNAKTPPGDYTFKTHMVSPYAIGI